MRATTPSPQTLAVCSAKSRSWGGTSTLTFALLTLTFTLAHPPWATADDTATVAMASQPATKGAPKSSKGPETVEPVGPVEGTLHRPMLRGRVIGWYPTAPGPRANTRVRHTGWSLTAPASSDVHAVTRGTVAYVGHRRGLGNLVVITHAGGYHSVYAHLGAVHVEVGQGVERGGVIGQSGEPKADRPSLYFEWRKHTRALDPRTWFGPDR